MVDRGQILDLFAGAGGWEEGLVQLGHRALGIEIDKPASASAKAAGHDRLIADVTALTPGRFDSVWGLIASPPCQAYSTSGSGLGRKDKHRVIACARDLAKGRDTRDIWRRRCLDPASLLTVEPLRFAFSLRPRWIAFEQVTPVKELWEEFADLLEEHGYRTAVKVLSSECFGVPQVRKRAFLIASLDGSVRMPKATHRSFDARRHRAPKEELSLRQWVSIAEALGWGGRPATLRSTHTNSGRHPGGAPRSFDRPAFTFMCGSGNWKIETDQSTARTSRRRSVCPEGAGPRFGSRKELERITVEQAAVIQGFRHDYPWQGTKNQRFAQIGNSVCPPVARHVLAEAMRPTLELDRERSDR